ncbi:MAG: hypothetical protein E7398_00980 [Ruminococcaceae bacterium]|nr:hypothetical protein [Oscillospiraceae bacterium]
MKVCKQKEGFFMKIRKIAFFVLVCLLTMYFAGCKNETPVNVDNSNSLRQKTASIYYMNSETNNLVKKETDIKHIEKNKIFSFIMEKVIENPNEEGIKSAVRAGTKCLWVKAEKNLVSLNLSKEFYNEQNIYDILSVGAIVKSLCSIEGIDSVNILIENNPLTNVKGEEIGILRDTDFVFDADSLESDEEYITLYFSDENGEYLSSEVRKIKVPKGEVMEKLIVSQLLEGPKNTKNIQVIPSGTKIISVETKEGVCFVNLSKEFISKHPGGTSAEIMTVYSIVNSLTELLNVNKVQFLIDGEIKELFNHIVINEPLERDTSYIIK